MNEIIKKIIDHVKNLWGKWNISQRLILVGIAVVVIVGIVALFSVSSSPSMIPVIDYPITEQAERDRVVQRINQEGARVVVNSAGLVQVADESTARRMRMILISEGLIPQGADPWNIFDKDRWTITDFERNVNFQRAQRQMITDHIKALDGIDNAIVDITFLPTGNNLPLFRADQNPASAGVIIFPKIGSDIAQNRKKIEGIQKLLKYAVMGLQDENIVITDSAGNILNDFAGMAGLDRLTIIERERKLIQKEEAQLRIQVLQALQNTFSADRVRDLNVKIEMDLSKKKVESEEYLPFTVKPQTPGLPYDDSDVRPSVTLSESKSTTTWEGRGLNPEGPAGVEGQTPPAFRDMDNLYGKMTQETHVHNEAINSRKTQEESSPQINRLSVSVNIDGKWEKKYDEKGRIVVLPNGTIEREYIPVSPEDIRATQAWIQGAIAYNPARGDLVTVQNISYDRSQEFADEDAAFFRKRQVQTTVAIFLGGLTLLLVAFIVFRVIARETERRRRLAEEERARREQALRESAMAEAEDGVEVSISMEERSRMELMESVVNLAKEHPEDCAQLIRTWILEE